jgi:predicted YcjX-like family ATPase
VARPLPEPAGGAARAQHARGGLIAVPDPIAEARAAAGALRRLLLGAPEETVRLAVTGLSRAGKTVFVTALAANLMAAPRDPRRMAGLPAVAEGRVVAVQEAGLTVTDAPLFPLRSALAALSGEAHWPEPTTRLTKLALSLEVMTPSPGWLGRQLGPSRRAVRLEVVDYPGEWLLDLPLLGRSFEAWSAAELARAEEAPRAERAAAWRGALAGLDPQAAAEHAVLARLAEAYTLYLRRCRDEAGLALLTPGRFLNPDAWAGMPFLLFCPLPLPAGGSPRAGSLWATMRAHYDEYLRRTRAEFLAPHMARFDAQIVLVDLFRALASGAASFADTRSALAEIAAALRPEGGWLARLGLARHPPRPVYAATKADYVPESQRGQLAALLRHLVGGNGATLAVAAAACTRDTTLEDRGRTVEAVEGLVEGGGREAFWFAGGIPVETPSAAWFDRRYAVPVFAPPAIDPERGLRHLNLDRVLAAALPEVFA